MKSSCHLFVWLVVALILCSSCTTPVAPTKTLLSFSLGITGELVTIDAKTKKVRIYVPLGSNITALAASFDADASSVRIGDAVQVSGTSINDFSTPLTFRLYGADETHNDYTVTVIYQLMQPWSINLSGQNRFEAYPGSGLRLTIDADLGATAGTLDFIFVNTAEKGSAASVPAISTSSIAEQNRAVAVAWSQGLVKGGKNPAARTIAPAAANTVGATWEFADVLASNLVRGVPLTLRKVVADNSTAGGRVVYFWVADDCWETGGTTKLFKVSQTTVDNLAQRFLNVSTQDDLYHWVTGLLGLEYYSVGDTVPNGLIPPSNEIHIILEDIDNDNQNTGTVGYFYDANDFLRTSGAPNAARSNEKLLLVLDGVILSNPVGGMDIGLSTLAHEFQHMIGLYQKTLKQGLVADTWMDEMCSMLVEDLVADKLMVPGPRGVAQPAATYNYGTGNIRTNDVVRLGTFNLGYQGSSLTQWQNFNSMQSYANAYSFGSWLLRNWGGAPLLRNLVTNNSVGVTSLLNAVQVAGGLSASASPTYSQLLQQWALAVIRSPEPASVPYLTSQSSPFVSSVNGQTYSLGSIDYTKYWAGVGSLAGPRVLSDLGAAGVPGSLPHSSLMIYQAGTAVTGHQVYSVEVPAGITLIAVKK